MDAKIKKTVVTGVMISILLGNFLYPTPVYARVSFNRFFRTVKRISRHVGRGTKFVVKLPDKATRWMGPVLGPIASTVLTNNIAGNARWGKVFRQAQRTSKVYESLEEKEKYLSELRNAYRDQANDLRKQANDIRESRKNLLDDLANGDITFEDYKNNVVALDDIADVYDTAADKFDSSADKMRIEDIGRILSRDLLNQVWGQVRSAVVYEATKEINKFVDPNIIKNIIDDGRVNLDTFLDGITSYHIDKHLGNGNIDVNVDDLKDRVRDRIKEILEENKEEFKNNWREKVDEIVKDMIKELEEEKNSLPEVETDKESKDDGEDSKPRVDDESLVSSNDKCNSGYEWDQKIGKCIQSNCNSDQIPNAHYSYVKDCVCGSSGSINEKETDPNKECHYGLDYKSCPGCVYACVGLKDECPAPPK